MFEAFLSQSILLAQQPLALEAIESPDLIALELQQPDQRSLATFDTLAAEIQQPASIELAQLSDPAPSVDGRSSVVSPTLDAVTDVVTWGHKPTWLAPEFTELEPAIQNPEPVVEQGLPEAKPNTTLSAPDVATIATDIEVLPAAESASETQTEAQPLDTIEIIEVEPARDDRVVPLDATELDQSGVGGPNIELDTVNTNGIDSEADLDADAALEELEAELDASETELGQTELEGEAGTTAASSAPQPLQLLGILDLTAEQQEIDQRRQIAIASGNVRVVFQEGELLSDRLHINLATQYMRADGNVRFVRGRQRFIGSRFEYNLQQETGEIFDVEGEIDTDTTDADLDLREDVTALEDNPQALDRPIRTASKQESIRISTGFNTQFLTTSEEEDANEFDPADPASIVELPVDLSSFRQSGIVTHWRFRAPKVTLVPDGWDAESVRMTNDPFATTDFEVRASSARYRELDEFTAELITRQPRFVLEDRIPIPNFQRRYIFDRRPRDAGVITFGYDAEDRGGFFVERTFEPISTDRVRVNLTPQLYLQRATIGDVDSENNANEDLGFPDNFGLVGRLFADAWPGGTITGFAELLTLNPEEFEDQSRASLRATQRFSGYRFSLESSYRNRLFNGSLGFQTVQSSLGAVLQSPNYRLGSTGINANYQLGVQRVNADTDREELLEPDRENNRVTLNRYQATAGLSRGFTLWQADRKPSDARWLRFDSGVVTPNVSLSLGLRGTYSAYSDDSSQPVLTGSASFNTTLGRFVRNWFDYTNIFVNYSQAILGTTSPFNFDRVADQQVISMGITQQIYGPIRFGVNTGFNLDTGERISTNYRLEYRQRAYNMSIVYNPILEVGTFGFELNDFNWSR
ncbi:MAG: DUF3769 domain-containing protein [Cyanobacteria bacterium P01_H01_bin.121]